jgi:hypothetical protein
MNTCALDQPTAQKRIFGFGTPRRCREENRRGNKETGSDRECGVHAFAVNDRVNALAVASLNSTCRLIAFCIMPDSTLSSFSPNVRCVPTGTVEWMLK